MSDELIFAVVVGARLGIPLLILWFDRFRPIRVSGFDRQRAEPVST